jgi:hypothetical protein
VKNLLEKKIYPYDIRRKNILHEGRGSEWSVSIILRAMLLAEVLK